MSGGKRSPRQMGSTCPASIVKGFQDEATQTIELGLGLTLCTLTSGSKVATLTSMYSEIPECQLPKAVVSPI